MRIEASDRGAGPYRRVMLALAFLGLLSVAPATAEAQVREVLEQYRSGDEMIAVECFAPPRPARRPLVLMLYGSGGLSNATGDVFRVSARSLAAQGYVVMIPHYFDRTHHEIGATFKSGEYLEWVETIGDAIKFADAVGEIDPDRIGVIGFSLGSGLAFYQAAHDPRIRAVAAISGAPFVRPETKIPPTLILHGSRDKNVREEDIKTFEESMQAREIPHGVHVYKGLGHNLDARRFLDASRRARQFFDVHVKRAQPLEQEQKADAEPEAGKLDEAPPQDGR